MKKVFDKPIDIVIPWVDGNDIEWQKEKAKYAHSCNNNEGNNSARFRDWDTLKYVLRSIYKYAPWVNNIYLVTCGQKPKWLNLDDPKIKLVFHKDFIPSKYLPTFNSRTIELNIHRIKGLSDNFILFNDDIILTNYVKPTVFFKNNLPCDTAILNTHCGWKSRAIYNIAFNDTAVINDHYNIKNVLKKNRKMWFNYKYGFKNNLQTFILKSCPRFPGFKQFHMTNSYLKSSFERMWEIENSELNSTCMDKFRAKTHVNQWLIREYQLVSGNFYPTNKYKIGIMIDFEKDGENWAIKKCNRYLFSKKYKMMCINDGDSISNYNEIRKQVKQLLDTKFPEKSPFEI